MRRALAAAAGAAALLAAGCRPDSRFLYHPRPIDEAAWRSIAQRHGAATVELQRDGARLRGWIVPGAARGADGRAGAVLYFGGNAEEPSWLLAHAPRLGGRTLVVVPYRGYGASTGTPHERALVDDALAVHDLVARRPDVDRARIAVWGRSLGSGVATAVAERRPVDAVVLHAPFDSVEALARLHLPMLAFLLTQRYDSLSRAPAIRAPLLAVIGGRDTVVPPEHSERLVAAWGGPTRRLRLPRATHDDLDAFPDAWAAVAAVLAEPATVGRDGGR